MRKTIIRILTGISVFLVCGAPSIRFDALFPALIPIPSHISSIGLVNRTATDEKLLNIIEGTISGEFIGQDKAISQQVLGGLMATLRESKKIEIVSVNEALKRQGISSIFPDPLSWYEVTSLCNEYNTNALIVLELYDTDYPAGANTVIVTAGFRFYDLVKKTIYDEYIMEHSLAWNGPKNETLLGNINRLIVNNDVVNNASFETGILYGQRISPSWFSVERKYYKKSKRDDNLALGARMMEANDWNGAIEYLQKAVETGHRKTCGRASHNLAIVYEILGDLDTSKDWAQKAYTLYNNKDSKNYIQILNNRIQDVKRLKLQENN